jgi:2-polyprenyl-6-methoxyphenol hydroxylase-like FAD-dependent oxidoreductase
VEQQPLAAIENPALDGREIALTQHSTEQMRALGLWQHIDPAALSPLRDARVLNGPSPFAMVISHQLSRHSELGWLLSNNLIRRAVGIPADQHDFGRSMLVCAMTHEARHHHVAWEWFD